MLSLFSLINFLLIIFLSLLLYKNRDLEHQEISRALFAVVLCIFIFSLIF